MERIQPDEALAIREDVSPFLVHLTRLRTEEQADGEDVTDEDGKTYYLPGPLPITIQADSVLKEIISSGRLRVSSPHSSLQFARRRADMKAAFKRGLFSAVCFTETPLSCIHWLITTKKGVQFEPYGLVFLKGKAAQRGVSPVLYVNNKNNQNQQVFSSLISLLDHEESSEAITRLFPLISHFGEPVSGHGHDVPESARNLDFSWEREWRYPGPLGDFSFGIEDLFVGLCPDDKIAEFETLASENKLPGLGFIDPMRTTTQYLRTLEKAQARTGVGHRMF